LSQVSLCPSPGQNAICVVHFSPPEDFPPTNEPPQKRDMSFLFNPQFVILLATETIDTHFQLCQEEIPIFG
jgi:hypothetical protein